ncbi:MAG: hypothetical protein AAB896_01315 [Patescibacteria group bacterium]
MDNQPQNYLNNVQPDPGKPTIFTRLKNHKVIAVLAIAGLVILGLLGYGIVNHYNQKLKDAGTSKVVDSKPKPTVSKSQKAPSSTNAKQLVDLPRVAKSTSTDIAVVTYTPPTNKVSSSGNWLNKKAYAADAPVTSRVIVYVHNTNIYTSIIDSEIYLYDTIQKQNYVLIKGGTESQAVFNSNPILLKNNKMLFTSTTTEPNNPSKRTTLVKSVDLISGKITQIDNIPTGNFYKGYASPDGKSGAFLDENKIVVLNTSDYTTSSYDVKMHGEDFQDGSKTFTDITWSADSGTIYYSDTYPIDPVHLTDGYPTFVGNNIFALDLGTKQPKQITNDPHSKIELAQYGSKLFFTKYTNMSNPGSQTVKSYIDLTKSGSSIVDIPNTDNFAWPLLPTADFTLFATVPGNDLRVNAINLKGELVNDVYQDLVNSGKLLDKPYHQSLLIGWADEDTLLIELYGNGLSADVYSYNIHTKAVEPVLESIS